MLGALEPIPTLPPYGWINKSPDDPPVAAVTCNWGMSPVPDAIASEYPEDDFGYRTAVANVNDVARVVALVLPPVTCNCAVVAVDGVTLMPTR